MSKLPYNITNEVDSTLIYEQRVQPVILYHGTREITPVALLILL